MTHRIQRWMHRILPAGAIALLWASPLLAQSNPTPPAPPQQANPPRAEKTEKPKSDSSKPQQAEPSKRQQAEPSKKNSDKDQSPRSDRSKEERSKDDQSKADRDRSDNTRPNADKPRSTDRQSERSTEKPRSQSNEKSDTASKRDEDRSERSSKQNERSDRDQSSQSDRSAKSDRDREGSRKSESQQRSAKDLGFTFSDQSDKGLKITNLTSVAAKTDLKQGDTIVSINDHRINSQRDFTHWIFAGGNNRLTVVVLRDGRQRTIYLDPTVFVEETVVSSTGGWLGVDLYDRFSRAAVILKVHPDSPAAEAGLHQDDLIVAIDGEEIRSPEHLGQVISGMAPGTEVKIEVERDRRPQVVDATLGRKDKDHVAQRTITREQPLPPRR